MLIYLTQYQYVEVYVKLDEIANLCITCAVLMTSASKETAEPTPPVGYNHGPKAMTFFLQKPKSRIIIRQRNGGMVFSMTWNMGLSCFSCMVPLVRMHSR